MTVSSVTIKRLESLTNWYKLTFVSRKDGIGESSHEMLVSEETLKSFRQQIDKALGHQSQGRDYPDNINQFMKED